MGECHFVACCASQSYFYPYSPSLPGFGLTIPIFNLSRSPADAKFDRGADILAHRFRMVRANKDSKAFLPVWARASDRPNGTQAPRKAEQILATIAAFPTYNGTRLAGIIDGFGADLNEALSAELERGHIIDDNDQHPLVIAERDSWLTVTLPATQRRYGPRRLQNNDAYDEDIVVVESWRTIIAELRQAQPSGVDASITSEPSTATQSQVATSSASTT